MKFAEELNEAFRVMRKLEQRIERMKASGTAKPNDKAQATFAVGLMRAIAQSHGIELIEGNGRAARTKKVSR